MSNEQNILQVRASCLRQIREFFYQRNVLEVDTPLLSRFSVTDPYMSAMSACDSKGRHQGYLQTSPEYAMKKLLCAGSGDIYQLSKVYRANESGQQHSPEFAMLEWYRLGFDEFKLMEEVADLLLTVLGSKERVDFSYQEAFLTFTGIDPLTISYTELVAFASQKLGELPSDLLFDNYLTLLFSECVEPQFEADKLTFVFDFPGAQSALAKVREVNGHLVANRFEVYSGGIELANGFYELTDAEEQLQRFKAENQLRQQLGKQPLEIDLELIEAIQLGMPECAGVALGFDRLLMILLKETTIKQVLPMNFCSPIQTA